MAPSIVRGLESQLELPPRGVCDRYRSQRLILIGHVEGSTEARAPKCGGDRGACVVRGIALPAEVGQDHDPEAGMVDLD